MKSFTSLFIAIVLASTSVFAAPEPVAFPLVSLHYLFPEAKEISWTTVGTFQKASFVYNNQVLSALFDGEGNHIANIRAISINELPADARKNLQEELKTYWISDLLVVSTTEGDKYFVQLEYAGNKIIRQSSGHKWSLYQVL